MKNIYIIIAFLLLSFTLLGQKEYSRNELQNDAVKKYKELINQKRNVDIESSNRFSEPVSKIKNLEKSAAYIENQTHQIDSLMLESWNEETNQLEPNQLEKWNWLENGLRKSWELFDYDTNTGKWICNDKEEYEWDDNGNKTIHLDFDPDSTGTIWHENAKEMNTYNSSLLITNKEIVYKDYDTNEWNTLAKIVYEYDNDQNQTLELNTIWDTISQKFINDFKHEYSYTETGETSCWLTCEWNKETNLWDTLFYNASNYEADLLMNSEGSICFPGYFRATKTEYKYNENNQQIERINYSKESALVSFLKQKKVTKSYDANGNNDSYKEFVWNEPTDDWVPSLIINYKYNNLNELIYRERLDYVDSLDTYVYRWNNNFEYDTESRQVYKICHTWDATNSSWVNDYERNYLFDRNGNPLTENKLDWDTITNTFITSTQVEHIYDLSIDFSQINYPSNLEYFQISNVKFFTQYDNMMLQETSMEQKDGKLETIEQFNFYYSSIETTGANKYFTSSISVYPNPATDIITLNMNDEVGRSVFELYNLQGKKVMREELKQSTAIDVSAVSQGTYFYLITNENEVAKGKLIVM